MSTGVRGWLVVAAALAAGTARAQGSAPPPEPPPMGAAPPAGLEARAEKPDPMATVARDAGYGGVTGILVGGGVALVERDHWGRDLAVGAGLGLIFGAAVGVVHAVYDQRAYDRSVSRVAAGPPPGAALLARDGLGRTDRDPVITGTTLSFALRF